MVTKNHNNDLQKESPETLEAIQAEMFMFNDIKVLSDVDIQTLVFEIKDMTLLASALKDSNAELITRFTDNFSDRFSIQFNNAKESVKDIDKDTVDQAQSEIVLMLRRLEKSEQVSSLKDAKRSPS